MIWSDIKNQVVLKLRLRKNRKKRDSDYHRQMRSRETLEEQNIRKQKDVDYHYRKRIHEEEEKTRKRLEKLKEENIKPLCLHGSYFRFLIFGKPRTSYYGQSLPSTKIVQDWKFLNNKINNEIMMGEEFLALSKKIARILKKHGVGMNDVVHLMIGNHNLTFGILGGIWHIGGVCSLSDTMTDIEIIRNQVNFILR